MTGWRNSAQASQAPASSARWPGLVWERVQGYSSFLIIAAWVLTLLYLLMISLPHVFSARRAAPLFESLPLVNWSFLVVHALMAVPPLVIGLLPRAEN